MNKHEKILGKIGRVFGFIGCMSLILMLLAMPIILLLFDESRTSMGIGLALITELVVWISIHGTSYFVGVWFLGDRYNPSHVSDGDTVWWPEKTHGYVKRNMVTNLIEIIVSLVFSVLYVVLLCIGYKNMLIILIGLIVSLIAAIIFYLFYKKQQYQVKNENLPQ